MIVSRFKSALSAKTLMLLPAGSEADFSSSSSSGSLKTRESLASISAGKRAPSRRYKVHIFVSSVWFAGVTTRLRQLFYFGVNKSIIFFLMLSFMKSRLPHQTGPSVQTGWEPYSQPRCRALRSLQDSSKS